MVGINKSAFKVTIDKNWFAPNEILMVDLNEFKCEVTKVYPWTLWRRFLFRLGFSVKLFECKLK